VIHLDTDAPLTTDDGVLVTDELWGIYFKRDRHGVQGGASPLTVGGDVELDPYPQTTNVDPDFPDMWCAALSHAMSRFEGCRGLYANARSGGVGAFTADNFPVFDYLKPNVYAVLDSNHGYKMIGVGREVAKVLVGEHSTLLYPFRFERFESGDLHPVGDPGTAAVEPVESNLKAGHDARFLGYGALLGGCFAVGLLSLALYDGWLKRTALGPVSMGLCRFLNVLLGVSAAGRGLAGVGLTAALDAFIVYDGRTNWLEGAQLMAVYVILAVTSFYLGSA